MNGHPRDAKMVSENGGSRLQQWFSGAATRGVRVKWPDTVAFPATNKCLECKKTFMLVSGCTVVPTINHRDEIRVVFEV